MVLAITVSIRSNPEALPWRVKLPGVRQSKITKGMSLAGL